MEKIWNHIKALLANVQITFIIELFHDIEKIMPYSFQSKLLFKKAGNVVTNVR